MFINDSILNDLVINTSDQFHDAAWSYYFRRKFLANGTISYYDTLKIYCGC